MNNEKVNAETIVEQANFSKDERRQLKEFYMSNRQAPLSDDLLEKVNNLELSADEIDALDKAGREMEAEYLLKGLFGSN